jgi:uncharacterized membrane protein HdeD (DUF308 family)
MDEHGSLLASLTRGTHVLGVALIGLGILSALAPGLTAAPVVILIGILVVLAGVARSVFAWRAWSAGKSPLGLLTGGLAVACGLALVFNPVSTVGTVSSLVALYMILDGGSGILFASELGDDEERTWIRGDAWLSIALGVSMWVGWPLSGLRALGVLVGMKLVSAGAVVLRLERGMQRVGAGVAALRSRLGG